MSNPSCISSEWNNFEPYDRLLPFYESALNLQLNRSHIQITSNDAQELQYASSFILDATISTTSQATGGEFRKDVGNFKRNICRKLWRI